MAGLPAPIRILVVDDEPSTRIMLQRWIRRSMAAEVSEASDGLEALEAISSGNIDILISDINMPVLDGIEMLTLLQGDPALKKMEVLIVSHVESEEKIRKIISLGVAGYLLKPLQYDSVVKRLQCAAARILERRERPGQEIERSRLRILVADPDPNYCDFAKSTLEVDFSVQTARGVAGVLVKSVRFKPDVILISPEVPGLKLEFLIDKLKSIPDFKKPKFFALGETADWPGGSDHIDGSLTRSFVPEASLQPRPASQRRPALRARASRLGGLARAGVVNGAPPSPGHDDGDRAGGAGDAC